MKLSYIFGFAAFSVVLVSECVVRRLFKALNKEDEPKRRSCQKPKAQTLRRDKGGLTGMETLVLANLLLSDDDD